MPALTCWNIEQLAGVFVPGFIELKQCKVGLKQALVRKLDSRHVIA
jgi:hypothetical protein